jgi:glycosyltransferase involved in cell wall biosynthesis
MKILTIYQTNEGGGYFKRLCRMMEAALNEGMEVHYISTGRFPISHSRLYFHKLPMIFKKKSLFYIYFFSFSQLYLAYLNYIYKFDAFVAFGSAYAFVFFLAKYIFNIPLITFIRGDWIRELHSKGRSRTQIWFSEFMERTGLSKSNQIYVVTSDLKKVLFDRYGIEKARILRNDIDTLRFYPRDSRARFLSEFDVQPDAFFIGFIGPFDPIKRVDVLIRAFEEVCSERCWLMLVGAGRDEKALRELVTNSGIERQVVFTGWREDVPEIFSAIDLLVLPSEYEGCPGVLLEALGCETPCIGSDVGGIAEVLKYKDLLFDPLSVESLKEKLSLILNSPTCYDRLKGLCLKRKEMFVFDWNEEIVALIRRASNQKREDTQSAQTIYINI